MTAEPQTEAVTAAPARQRSLAGRLVLFAAVWSTLALVIAGFILVGLYRAAGERAFDSQLEVHLNTIIGEMVSSETTGGATPGVKRPEKPARAAVFPAAVRLVLDRAQSRYKAPSCLPLPRLSAIR